MTQQNFHWPNRTPQKLLLIKTYFPHGFMLEGDISCSLLQSLYGLPGKLGWRYLKVKIWRKFKKVEEDRELQPTECIPKANENLNTFIL